MDHLQTISDACRSAGFSVEEIEVAPAFGGLPRDAYLRVSKAGEMEVAVWIDQYDDALLRFRCLVMDHEHVRMIDQEVLLGEFAFANQQLQFFGAISKSLTGATLEYKLLRKASSDSGLICETITRLAIGGAAASESLKRLVKRKIAK